MGTQYSMMTDNDVYIYIWDISVNGRLSIWNNTDTHSDILNCTNTLMCVWMCVYVCLCMYVYLWGGGGEWGVVECVCVWGVYAHTSLYIIRQKWIQIVWTFFTNHWTLDIHGPCTKLTFWMYHSHDCNACSSTFYQRKLENKYPK